MISASWNSQSLKNLESYSDLDFLQSSVTVIYSLFVIIEWFFSFEFSFNFDRQVWTLVASKYNLGFICTSWFFWANLESLVYCYFLMDHFGQFDFLNTFFSDYFPWNAQEWMFLTLHTPELHLTKTTIKFFVEQYVFYNNIIVGYSSVINGVYLVFQSFADYLLIIYIIYWISALLILCYQNIFREDSTIDYDYTIGFLSVLSEKELSAIDDIFNLLFIFFFVFGWFLYLYGILVDIYTPELLFVLILIPFFWYSLLFIPIFLLFDFSFNFISYLRGIGVSSVSFVEFIFDYINCSGFLLRTYVQNVRFLIILLVCYSINEIWLHYDISATIFLSEYETFDEVINSNVSYLTMLYYLVWYLIQSALYLIYEIAHTFFILVVQFAAFVIMVFWLFSFLYTYFAVGAHEKFFNEYRENKYKKVNENNKFQNPIK